MKKWIIGCVFGIGVGLWLLYLIIPPVLVVSKIQVIHCTMGGGYRSISDSARWPAWSPDSSDTAGSITSSRCFVYKNDTFCFAEKLGNGAKVTINHNGLIIPGAIELFQVGLDSVTIRLQCALASSNNPLTKIERYRAAVQIRGELAAITEQCKKILENPQNVYHFPIYRSSTNDSFLIATKSTVKRYPSTAIVYNSLKRLQDYAKNHGAIQTDYPMLNVTSEGQDQYQFMIGIPINKILPKQDAIFPTKLVPGNFMVTEVRGSQQRIDEALNQLNFYFSDYGKTAMAIPFQSLITDRSKEPDSTRWITRLSAPVMK